jgi:hypothetical protein
VKKLRLSRCQSALRGVLMTELGTHSLPAVLVWRRFLSRPSLGRCLALVTKFAISRAREANAAVSNCATVRVNSA